MECPKILVPTDFSDTANLAARHAVALARLFEAEITLFHARTIFHDTPAQPNTEGDPVESDLRKLAQELGASAEGPPGVNIESANDVSAADAILGLLEEDDFGLVVMGTHGRSGLAHFVLGSVAETVVRKAPCPVVTIRAGAKGDDSPAYRNILVGFDFSDHSRAAIREAASLALRNEGRVEVLYVFEQQIHPAYYPIWEEMATKILPEIENDARKSLGRIFGESRFEDWSLKVIHAQRRAAAEIAAHAEDHEVDLIVLGTHGFSGLDHFLLGSTSERVMRIAPCPVMTIKLSDQGEAAPQSDEEGAEEVS